MALTFNRDAAMAKMAARMQEGLDRGLNDMTAIAVKHAPVRKPSNAGKRAKGELIDPRPLTDFSGTGERARKSREQQAEIIGLSGAERVNLFKKAAEKNPGVAREIAKRFRIRSGPNKGRSPSFVKVARGTLVGVGVQGGNLKSKIRRTEVTVSGNRVSGKLISGAPYSNVMEFGFIHVGGKRVPANPFMRPAKAHFATNWRDYFKR